MMPVYPMHTWSCVQSCGEGYRASTCTYRIMDLLKSDVTTLNSLQHYSHRVHFLCRRKRGKLMAGGQLF